MREQKIMRLRLRFCYMQKSNEKKPILFFITFFLHQNNTFYSKKVKVQRMYGNSDTRFSTIREIFSRALTIGNLNQNFAHFLKCRIKKIPAFFDIWYIAIWISRFFFIWCILSFPHFFSLPLKSAGKFKLKFHQVQKVREIQIKISKCQKVRENSNYSNIEASITFLTFFVL